MVRPSSNGEEKFFEPTNIIRSTILLGELFPPSVGMIFLTTVAMMPFSFRYYFYKDHLLLKHAGLW